MSLRLRPGTLDELGLLSTLKSYLEDFAEKTGIKVDFEHWSPDVEMGQDVRIGAYRIIQEALTNVVRHAKASQVAIHVELNGKTLDILIQDNGAGFNPTTVSTNSSGLRGIRERAQYLGGTFNLESAPGRGTKIMVKLHPDDQGKCADKSMDNKKGSFSN